MAEKTAYWSRLPTFPGRYKYRTSLSQAFTLQVSGRRDGTRHATSLYLVSPEGAMRRIWSKGFSTAGAETPDTLKAMACSCFVRAAQSDPELKDRLTIDQAADAAASILGGLRTRDAKHPAP